MFETSATALCGTTGIIHDLPSWHQQGARWVAFCWDSRLSPTFVAPFMEELDTNIAWASTFARCSRWSCCQLLGLWQNKAWRVPKPSRRACWSRRGSAARGSRTGRQVAGRVPCRHGREPHGCGGGGATAWQRGVILSQGELVAKTILATGRCVNCSGRKIQESCRFHRPSPPKVAPLQ